jgi:hypothetical protein
MAYCKTCPERIQIPPKKKPSVIWIHVLRCFCLSLTYTHTSNISLRIELHSATILCFEKSTEKLLYGLGVLQKRNHNGRHVLRRNGKLTPL